MVYEEYIHTYTHGHFAALLDTVQDYLGEPQGKTNLDLLQKEIVASAGLYANLHLDPDTTMPAFHHSVFCRPDALPATQPTVSKH